MPNAVRWMADVLRKSHHRRSWATGWWRNWEKTRINRKESYPIQSLNQIALFYESWKWLSNRCHKRERYPKNSAIASLFGGCILFPLKSYAFVYLCVLWIYKGFFVFTSVVFFKKRWLDCFLYSKCTQAGKTIDVEKKMFFPFKGSFWLKCPWHSVHATI